MEELQVFFEIVSWVGWAFGIVIGIMLALLCVEIVLQFVAGTSLLTAWHRLVGWDREDRRR